ncbi:MAG: TolC family protein [Treponemataceae bacterium]|nr:TolC family protein [Treponemataceae bacterium]
MKKLVSAFFVVVSLFVAGFFRPYSLPPQNCAWAESYGNSDYVLSYVFSQLDMNNTELRRLREEYAQSILDVKDAKAGYGPSIDLLVTGTYMTDPMIGKIALNLQDIISAINLPGSDRINLTDQTITLYPGMENTQYQFQLTLTQPLFTWGKISSAVKLYTAASEVKQLQVLDKQAQLETEIRTRLAALYYMRQIRIYLDEEQEYAKKLVSISEQVAQNGLLLQQKVLDARIQAMEIDIAKAGIEDEYTKMLSSLEKLTGLSFDEIEEIRYIPDKSEADAFLLHDVKVLQENAVAEDRLSLQILQKLIEINVLTLNIAEASVYWKPDVALQLSADYSGSRFPLIETDWYRKDDSSLNITLAVKTTVWDGGKKINDIKRNESNSTLASIQYEDTELLLKHTVLEQYNQMKLAKTKADYQLLKIETKNSQIEQATKAFQTGYGSEADLITAQIEKCTAQIEMLQNVLSYMTAYYTLSYMTE